jgi:AraC-like DNA-binding protein
MAAAAKEYLCKCLAESGGNVAKAARIAGLNRPHFYRLCDRYQVISPVPPPRKAASVFRDWASRKDPTTTA